jgi:hypothetical protein
LWFITSAQKQKIMALNIVIMLICAVGSCLIARSKGRNQIGWFFGGFFLGLIGLVIILCMSNLNEEKAKHDHLLNEQRRLREQLRQERMRNQSFQDYTNNRLDVHDERQNIDTRSANSDWDEGKTHELEITEDEPVSDPKPESSVDKDRNDGN